MNAMDSVLAVDGGRAARALCHTTLRCDLVTSVDAVQRSIHENKVREVCGFVTLQKYNTT
jgi:hypothetical protein